MIDVLDSFGTDAEGNYVHPTIYKRDSVGKLRVWRMERNGSRYRTVAGIEGGSLVTSGWTQAKAASCDTDEAQALFEVKAKYKHQLDREYRMEISELDGVKDVFLEPMLAKPYDEFPGPGFVQPKFDGIRCIAKADGLFSRQGQAIVAVPHIQEALAPVFAQHPDLILDGELYNHEFREDFGAISSIVRKKTPTAEQLKLAERVMQYHVYDLVADHRFGDRSQALRTFLSGMPECIQQVPTHDCPAAEDADWLHAKLLEAGYEGSMFRLDAPYEIGKRSKNLLKRKEFITDEFEVVAIEEGNGNWAGLAKRVVCRLPDGRTFGAGIRGSQERAKQLLSESHKQVTVRFFCLSPDGVPRFPVVIDFHGEGRAD